MPWRLSTVQLISVRFLRSAQVFAGDEGIIYRHVFAVPEGVLREKPRMMNLDVLHAVERIITDEIQIPNDNVRLFIAK